MGVGGVDAGSVEIDGRRHYRYEEKGVRGSQWRLLVGWVDGERGPPAPCC